MALCSRTNVCLQVCAVPWHVCDYYITATSWRVCNTESCDFLSTSQERRRADLIMTFAVRNFLPAPRCDCIPILFCREIFGKRNHREGYKMHLKFTCFTASECSETTVFIFLFFYLFFYVIPNAGSPAPSTLHPTKAALSSLLWHHHSQHQ